MRAAYPNRKRLAPGVTTPQMERWLRRRWRMARRQRRFAAPAAAVASRFFVPKAGKLMSNERSSAEEGAEVLDWKFSHEGLVVSSRVR